MRQAVVDVTSRIRERSSASRRAYLARIDAMLARPRGPERLGCANLAHATAALPRADKLSIVAARAPNIGVVTAYNDMLSAHQPYERFPAVIRAPRTPSARPRRSRAACRRCATASPRAARAWR